MSKTARYSFVGNLFPKYRSTEFPLLCSICEEEIPKPDIAAVYFDNGSGVLVAVHLKNCELKVQAECSPDGQKSAGRE